MKVKFEYDRQSDIWCLLNTGSGKRSLNSPFPTPEYKQLVSKVGENPSEENTSLFIDEYLKENNFSVDEYITKYQKDFDEVSEEFQKRAEKIFGISLVNNVSVYLTVNRRLPHNREENYFL